LRSSGHCIYTNVTKNGKKAYRLGRPSRAMVAACAAVFGNTFFQ